MKKITAIVLCVLLAMSALVVLTACGTTEYVVSFREYNSKIIYQGKTINGKAVEPKAPVKEGYEFKGWYKTLTATEGESGTIYNFADEMDFDKAVDGDLDLYAKYEVSSKPAPSSNPYYVVGNFADDSWNPGGIADLSRMLKPVNGILTATFKATGTQEFKLKYADSGWHDDLDVGYSALKGVTLADGVELPAGIATVDDLIINGGGNIKVNTILSKLGKDLKIKLTYIEATKSINIEVLEIPDNPEGPAQPWENGYRIAGTIGGADKWASLEADYALTQGEGAESHLYTKTGLTLAAGDAFKIKENAEGWASGDFGFGALGSVTLADGVTLPTGIEAASDLFTDGGGNINAAAACTVTVTYNFLTDKISIVVTAF